MESLKEQDVEAELTARRARLQRLEFEAAEERAAIALLEQTKARTLPNLLDNLPQELRDHIWGYCVAPGKVLFSKSRVACDARFDDFHEYEKPYWPLLAVSRSIRQEAAKVLFEQNQFIWSHLTSGFQTLVGGGYYPRDSNQNDIRLLAFAHKHLRSVSLTFDLRSPISQNSLMNAACMRASLSLLGIPWSRIPETLRRSYAHDYTCDSAYEEVEDLLRAVLDCKVLTNFELDFTNCYCPTGCCRVLDEVLETRIDTAWQLPAHLRILGTRNQSERDSITDELGRYHRAERPKTTVVFENFAASREMQDPFMGWSPFWCHLTEEDLDVELGRDEVNVEKTEGSDEDEE